MVFALILLLLLYKIRAGEVICSIANNKKSNSNTLHYKKKEKKKEI